MSVASGPLSVVRCPFISGALLRLSARGRTGSEPHITKVINELLTMNYGRLTIGTGSHGLEPEAGTMREQELSILDLYAGEGIIGDQQIPVQVGIIDQGREVRCGGDAH